MKKWTVIAVLCALLFNGCTKGNSAVDQAMALRNRLADAAGCRFDCIVLADYSEYTYSFQLACSADSNGVLTFTVTEPASIAGITGTIDSNGGHLTFEDYMLAYPSLADGYLSPLNAPWLMLKALRGGYISYCTANDSGLMIGLDDSYMEEPIQVQLWTDPEASPIRSELYWRNRCILSLEITNYTYL